MECAHRKICVQPQKFHFCLHICKENSILQGSWGCPRQTLSGFYEGFPEVKKSTTSFLPNHWVSAPVKKYKIWMSVELVAKSCHKLERWISYLLLPIFFSHLWFFWNTLLLKILTWLTFNLISSVPISLSRFNSWYNSEKSLVCCCCLLVSNKWTNGPTSLDE